MSKSLIAALTLFAAGASAADFKAAYVDLQRALGETDEGKAAMARLKAWADSKEKQVEKEKTSFQAEVDAFQKQVGTMEEKARSAKELELQKRYVELAQKAEKARAEMAEQQRKELGSVMPKMEQLLGQIAQREGLTMVFDKSSSGLAWAPASLDLTNELIRMYNAQFKATAPKAAPGKPAAPKPDAPKSDAPKAP
jgi:outer membrane protein